jgi:SAM-dependent methyltransferase
MPQIGLHAMYPEAVHDEQSRQNFIRNLRSHVLGTLLGGTPAVYEARVKPAFERSEKRAPRTAREAFNAMQEDDYAKTFSSLNRTTQEMLYDTVGPSIARQLPALVARSKKGGRKLGSLTLDPAVRVPRYNAAADIHCKPGGYHSEITEDDLFAGAEYDRSINVYFFGTLGPYNEDMGASVAHWLRTTYPAFAPKRILDMGCTIGHSTLPYCEVFPQARIDAIDVAAPVLRYGHARAEALGCAVHFAQQNAEATSFGDESFDLVVSHLLLHETSTGAMQRIFGECHRLLRPGGIMVHMDGVAFKDDPFDGYFSEWLTHYNNEPFLGTLQRLDWTDMAAKAGFARDQAFGTRIPSRQVNGNATLSKKETGTHFIFAATKAV